MATASAKPDRSSRGRPRRAVREVTVDVEGLGARGMGYEHLDQLAMEYLYGVR